MKLLLNHLIKRLHRVVQKFCIILLENKRVKIVVPENHPSKKEISSSNSKRSIHIYKNINSTVSKRSIELLLLYAESFENYELIIKSLTLYGIENSDWKIRMNWLITVSALLEQKPQLINEKNNDFLLLIEAIIIRLKDTSDWVRQQASITLSEIVDTHFSKLQRLAFWMNPKQRDQLLIYLDEWERTRIRINEEHGGMKVDPKIKEEEKLQNPTENEIQIFNENGDPTDYLLVEDPSWAMAPNGLAFGVIPRDVMNAAELHNHVGTRVIAMREMEKIIEEEGSLESNGLRNNNSKVISEAPQYSLLDYGSLFLRYLSIILEDTSQEVLYSIFRVVKKILAIPGFGNKGNFQSIAISIAKYSFKHKVVSIRQEAQIVMREIMLTMKSRIFIGTMVDWMNTEEWMIKIEWLKAIITWLIDTNDRNFEGMTIILLNKTIITLITIELDYVNLISAITLWLADDKPRVRYIANETIATLWAYANKNVVLGTNII